MGLLDKVKKAKDKAGPKPKLAAKLPSRSKLTPDQRRIVGLRKVPEYVPADIAHMQKPCCGIVLYPEQLQALQCLREEQGGIFPLPVGFGKTFIAILAPGAMGRKYSLVVAPAPTCRQLREEMEFLDMHFKLQSVSTASYHDISTRKEGRPPTLDDWMDRVIRDGGTPAQCVLIFDEAHMLSNPKSARTMRTIRFVRKYPDVATVFLSGTMTSEQPSDFAHLCALALRERSPLPLDLRALKRWDNMLGVEGDPESGDEAETRPVLSQYGWVPKEGESKAARKRGARRAFATHVRQAAGVVASDSGQIGTSLHINRIMQLGAFKGELKAALELLLEEGCSPDGEQYYDDPADISRVAKQLSVGFYYRQDWGDRVPDVGWMNAKANWNRLVRHELETRARENYDTEMLVRQAVQSRLDRGERSAIADALEEWNRHIEKEPPNTVPVWLDYSVMDWAADFGKKHKAAVWYQSIAVGEALAERMKTWRRGEAATASYPESAAYNIKSHGTGLRLQEYSEALVLQPPSSGKAWEQLLGRLHRRRQKAPTVTFHVLQHTTQLQTAMRTARKRDEYFGEGTKTLTRLAIATWDKVAE